MVPVSIRQDFTGCLASLNMTFGLIYFSYLLSEICLDVFDAFLVLSFGADGNAEHVAHSRLRADDGSLGLQELEGVHRILETADGNEVRVAINVGEAEFLETSLELSEASLVEFADLVHVFLVVDSAVLYGCMLLELPCGSHEARQTFFSICVRCGADCSGRVFIP